MCDIANGAVTVQKVLHSHVEHTRYINSCFSVTGVDKLYVRTAPTDNKN